ncbi:hypothetical protein BaRGS_00007890 [Batillaria attramentaria]|uniref:Uncharacterized protein n=1 Tax=Batillaria attramentaria TaxID=370345 RepID=A0ABD0LNI3_9CAEN
MNIHLPPYPHPSSPLSRDKALASAKTFLKFSSRVDKRFSVRAAERVWFFQEFSFSFLTRVFPFYLSPSRSLRRKKGVPFLPTNSPRLECEAEAMQIPSLGKRAYFIKDLDKDFGVARHATRMSNGRGSLLASVCRTFVPVTIPMSLRR